MTPEAARYLAKARQCLDHARTILQSGIGEDAGRNAYLAAFHAAQALIFERTGRAAKTHKGVHSQFGLLAKGEPRIDGEIRGFLAQGYKLKEIADYETGPGSDVPVDRAAEAIHVAQKFVDCIARLLA